MKKYLIKSFLLSIILFTLLSIYNSVYADGPARQSAESNSGINLDITSDKFYKEFKPGANDSSTTNDLSSPFINTIVKIINPVLGIVQVVGAILSVLSIALFGMNMVLSSSNVGSALFNIPQDAPGARASMMEYLRYLIIGSVLLTASVTIVRLVFDLFISN